MKIDELHVDNSTKIYLDKTIMLLDTYAPLKNAKRRFVNRFDSERLRILTVKKHRQIKLQRF